MVCKTFIPQFKSGCRLHTKSVELLGFSTFFLYFCKMNDKTKFSHKQWFTRKRRTLRAEFSTNVGTNMAPNETIEIPTGTGNLLLPIFSILGGMIYG